MSHHDGAAMDAAAKRLVHLVERHGMQPWPAGTGSAYSAPAASSAESAVPSAPEPSSSSGDGGGVDSSAVAVVPASTSGHLAPAALQLLFTRRAPSGDALTVAAPQGSSKRKALARQAAADAAQARAARAVAWPVAIAVLDALATFNHPSPRLLQLAASDADSQALSGQLPPALLAPAARALSFLGSDGQQEVTCQLLQRAEALGLGAFEQQQQGMLFDAQLVLMLRAEMAQQRRLKAQLEGEGRGGGRGRGDGAGAARGPLLAAGPADSLLLGCRDPLLGEQLWRSCQAGAGQILDGPPASSQLTGEVRAALQAMVGAQPPLPGRVAAAQLPAVKVVVTPDSMFR